MNRKLTLGSLFDGSGGFPLGAIFSGIQPVWASEIEPFPIRVTTRRLPFMKHLGDINRISGAEIEPVDIITFGSPCTDLSVAGRRSGLDGRQSSLFYQAIRIIREMRCATHGRYPRYIVWENVPGAFSSNKGQDFKAVLDAVIQIIEPGAEVPAADQWPYADTIMGNGWSLAYRVVDAQHFGLAQRRKRIYLVADFGSERAGDILFEREGVSRDFAPGCGQGEATAGHPARRAGAAVAFEPGAASRLGGHCWEELAGALRADAGDNQAAVVYGIGSFDSEGMKSANPHAGVYEAKTSRTLDQGGGNPACNQGGMAVVAFTQNQRNEVRDLDNRAGSLVSSPGAKQQTFVLQGSMVGRADKNGPQGDGLNEDISFTLNTADRHAVAYAMTTGGFCDVSEEISAPLMARDYKDAQIVNTPRYAVRRLTPTECALLQGFPSDWCAGLETPAPTEEEITWWAEVLETHRRIIGTASKAKSRKQIVKWLQNPYSDAAAYKMWGNGVALPCVCFVLRGFAEGHQSSLKDSL